MHKILGYTISEWLEILSIIGIIGSYSIYLVNKIIIIPLKESIQQLSIEIKDFKKSSRDSDLEIFSKIKKNEDRLDNHDIKIASHEERITTLFKKFERK